jgi:hypothetical protein
VAARGPAGVRLRAARIVEDLFVSAPLQLAALELVSSPGWRRHLKALRAGLRERRDAMAGALSEHFGAGAVWHVPTGGLHMWLRPARRHRRGGAGRRRRARRRHGGRLPAQLRGGADRPAPAVDVRGRAADVLVEGVERLARLGA